MDDVHIPEEHRRVLQLGPKFCLEPHLRAIDKVALARSVSNKVKEEDKSRCITECVELLPRSEGRKKRVVSLDPAIDFFTTNGLRVLLSDKEGSFVVMPEGMFSEKAGAAVCKNFREVSEKPQEAAKPGLEAKRRLKAWSWASIISKGTSWSKTDAKAFCTCRSLFSAKKPCVPQGQHLPFNDADRES
ncbi:hypothetical protein HPB51_024537 [Rhipicephalus microplus]|uniref:Tick transposon n=1 Tax=Rhipicephalus microplus TaxID=6941 RepID=A0A9J6DKH9_RHIMP|nr:hypothetical protein HPB51_024537 [Rhipicephalus microplus]